MNDDVRNIALGVIAAGISAALGWVARTYLWRRKLRRKQAFFGLPENSECLLVVNRDAGSAELSVHRHDVFALLELAALVKDCGADAEVSPRTRPGRGSGSGRSSAWAGRRRTGGWRRTFRPCCPAYGEHRPRTGPGPLAFQIGGEHYRMESGITEYVLLARLTAGQRRGGRPVFLFCGQRAINNQAATRYLVRHHERLARKHGGKSFVLLLKVINSQAYGPDVVELVDDVTRAAQAPLPATTIVTPT